jgi:hypothetical protein
MGGNLTAAGGFAGDGGSAGGGGGAGGSGGVSGAGGFAGGLGVGTLVTFGERSGTTYSNVAMDTFISSQAPTGSYWKYGYLSVQSAPDTVTLIRFDVSALAPTVTVTGGELSVEVWQNPVTAGSINVHQVLEPWIDSQTLWAERLTGVAWTTVGCGVGSHSATILGSFAPVAKAEYKITLPATVIQGWVRDASTNFGLALVGDGASYVDFKASNVGVGKQPVLAVTYTP